MNLDNLTISGFLEIAPFATIVVVILLVGVGIAAYFTGKHIATLQAWIKDKDK